MIAVLIGLVIRALTRNTAIALVSGGALAALTVLAYFLYQDKFEGLLPKIMKQLSLFDRFTTFVNGVFDLSSLVFYASVIALGLFLTVQSLEKRRYN